MGMRTHQASASRREDMLLTARSFPAESAPFAYTKKPAASGAGAVPALGRWSFVPRLITTCACACAPQNV